MPPVRLTARARRDLPETWLWIARDNEPAADRKYYRLERRLHVLETLPEVGMPRAAIAPDARLLVTTVPHFLSPQRQR